MQQPPTPSILTRNLLANGRRSQITPSPAILKKSNKRNNQCININNELTLHYSVAVELVISDCIQDHFDANTKTPNKSNMECLKGEFTSSFHIHSTHRQFIGLHKITPTLSVTPLTSQIRSGLTSKIG